MSDFIYFRAVPKEDGTIDYIPTNEPPPPAPPPEPVELPYNLKRERNYPVVEDQLDMLWHMMDDNIIPGKNSIWYNSIKQVKDTFPKP